MISIIIPLYNCQDKIIRCLDSIIDQTFTNYEVIVVNDGSTDNSYNVVKTYASKHAQDIKLITKENGGVSSARNAGIEVSVGEYLCFVDADDYVEPNYLSELFNAIKSNNCDLAICNIFSSNNKKVQQKELLTNNEIIRDILDIEYNQAAFNKIFKRHIIGKIRFDKEIYMGEDTLFCIEYAKQCKSAVHISNGLYHYDTSTASLLYRENRTYLSKLLTLVESRKKMLADTTKIEATTTQYICQNLIENIMYISIVATDFYSISCLKLLSKEMSEALRKYNGQKSFDWELLSKSAYLYFIKKTCQIKTNNLKYRFNRLFSRI